MKLTVIKDSKTVTFKSGQKRKYVLVMCACGKKFETQKAYIKSGHTKSCGCKWFNPCPIPLGSYPLYGVLQDMKKRCYNDKCAAYKDYGGRGISVCDEWMLDPYSFIKWGYENGYKKGLEIDRIDNDKGYSPNNCRIVTRQINACNRRKRSDSMYKYKGVSKKNQKWRSSITSKGVLVILGLYDTEIEAAIAYDNYIKANNLPHLKNEYLLEKFSIDKEIDKNKEYL